MKFKIVPVDSLVELSANDPVNYQDQAIEAIGAELNELDKVEHYESLHDLVEALCTIVAPARA